MDGKNRSIREWAKPRAVVVGLACFLAWCLTGSAQAQLAESSPGHQVDRIFRGFDKPDSPGCAVSVSIAGRIIYSRGYGMADLDHKIAITPTTVFHAASLAKQFTAMSIMLLVRQGKLSLDDPVDKYIELPVGKRQDGKHITIRDMLQMISGIRDQWALVTLAGWRLYDDLVTQDDVLELVSQMKTLDFEPRTDIIYSNTGYTLAAQIVKHVSKKSLSDFARDSIFQPLGMNDTVISKTHGLIIPNLAYGYWRRQDDRPFELGMPNLDVIGPTNLLTTVEDLARWDRNFDDQTVGGADVLSEMQTEARLSDGSKAVLDTDALGIEVHYGLGVELTKYRGLKVVEHDGRDAGYRAHLIRFPDQSFAVACLCNLALPEDNLPRKLVRQIADVYLADKLAPAPREHPGGSPAVLAMTSPDLSDYTGRYYSKEIDTTYSIELKSSSLVIARHKYPDTRLTQTSGDVPDTFAVEGFSRLLATGVVLFDRNSQGKIDRFRISGRRIGGGDSIRDFPFKKQ